MRCLVCRAKLVDRRLPAGGVGGQRLSHQSRLTLEASADFPLEIPPERALRHPEQDGHGQNENEDHAKNQPLDEGHRLLAPRSLPLRR